MVRRKWHHLFPLLLLQALHNKQAFIRSYHRRGGMTATQKAGAVGIMTAMVLLSTFVFIPEGSVARIIVPVAGAVGALTVVFFVPNAKNDED